MTMVGAQFSTRAEACGRGLWRSAMLEMGVVLYSAVTCYWVEALLADYILIRCRCGDE